MSHAAAEHITTIIAYYSLNRLKRYQISYVGYGSMEWKLVGVLEWKWNGRKF